MRVCWHSEIVSWHGARVPGMLLITHSPPWKYPDDAKYETRDYSEEILALDTLLVENTLTDDLCVPLTLEKAMSW